MATWYASPTGSGTTGSLASPFSLTTAASGNSGAIHAGDTIYLRGGIYQVPAPPSGLTFAVAGSSPTTMTVYTAYPNERPIITSTTNAPPNIHMADYQRLDGLWIGGTRQTSDTANIFIGAEGGLISNWKQLTNCTFWGYYGGVLSGSAQYALIQGNRFVQMGAGSLFHPVYISNSNTFPGPAGTNTNHIIMDNNMMVAGGNPNPAVGGGGWGLHYFHNNRTGIMTRNRVFGPGNWGLVFDGIGVLVANNLMWKTYHLEGPTTNPGIDPEFTQGGGLFINNITGLNSYFNPANHGITVNKNAFDTPPEPATGTNPIILTPGQEAAQIGASTTTIDSAVAALRTSFSASPTTILADSTIEPNFSTLKNITVPNGSPLLNTGQPWFSAAATNLGPDSGAPATVDDFWTTYAALGLPEYNSNGSLPTIIPVHAGDNLQTKINSAGAGDILQLDAGVTWDTPNSSTAFTLPNTPTIGRPITIRSSAWASLPNGRVSPSDATNMPRIRATGFAGAFNFAPSASYWILDGLEITNIGLVNQLIDCPELSQSHVTITRCYIHPKEAGTTNYDSTVTRGVYYNGTYLRVTRCYFQAFNQNSNSNVLLSVAGSNVVFDDNYSQAYYTSIFSGGGGTGAEQFATATSVTLSSATFTNTTGLINVSNAIGSMILMQITGTGTFDANTHVLTRLTGPQLTSGDTTGNNGGGRAFWLLQSGTQNVVGRWGLTGVSGNAYTLGYHYSPETPVSGTYDWVLFSVVKVTGTAGSTVNYTPYGPNQLVTLPTGGVAPVSWRTTPTVHDWTITHNTFNIDDARAQVLLPNTRPKAWFEFKDMYTCLIEGNTFTGFPSVLALVPRSNEGWTPWTTMQDVTIQGNFFNPTLNQTFGREWLIGELEDTYNSSVSSTNLIVNNNLVVNTATMYTSILDRSSQYTHNTIINLPANDSGNYLVIGASSITVSGWVFENNIGQHNTYGLNCLLGGGYLGCWPGSTLLNNVLVDNDNLGDLPSLYGAGVLLPIVNSFSQVGFIQSATNNYQLSPTSVYHNAATDGTDPGVNWASLVSSLGYDPAGSSAGTGTTLSGSVTISGPVVID